MTHMKNFYFFYTLFIHNLSVRLEYRVDAFILFFGGGALQVVNFLFISILFSKIPSVDGWLFWELVFMLAIIFFTEGISSFFFEGPWQMSVLVNKGELDRILIRPASPITQILCSSVGIHGIGNIIIGGFLLGLSMIKLNLDFSWDKIFFLPVLLVSACIIRVSISLASNCAAFWIKGQQSLAFPLLINQLADIAKFPINLFGPGIQFLVTAIVPYAFISYYPAIYLFNKWDYNYMAWLLPLVAFLSMIFARKIFYTGLKRYESTAV